MRPTWLLLQSIDLNPLGGNISEYGHALSNSKFHIPSKQKLSVANFCFSLQIDCSASL